MKEAITYYKKLKRYSLEWLTNNLLTEEEYLSVNKYINNELELNKPESKTLLRNTTIILYILGTALILSGIIFFFASNWQIMKNWHKITLIFTGMSFFYSLAFILSWFNKPKSLYHLALLSGAIFFGTSVALIGQMYQLPANSFLFFTIWSIPMILFALLHNYEAFFTFSGILVNFAIWFYFFPQLETSNWWNGYLILKNFLFIILINIVLITLIIFTLKNNRGITAAYISQIIIHLNFFFISFNEISKNFVFLINFLYFILILSSFWVFIKIKFNRFFIYSTLTFTLIWIITKYFEIILETTHLFDMEEMIFIIMILSGIIFSPLSYFFVKISNKTIKRLSNGKL